MILGIVLAVGIGLIVVGGFGSTASASEYRPDKEMVTLFIILFLLGMCLLGGGLGFVY